MRGLGRNNTLVALSLLFWGLGSGLFQFIWPLYIKSLGANTVEIGLALAFSGVVAMLIYIPGGMAADRYSRKNNIVASWVLGTLAVLVYALAQDWRQLLIGIALMSASQFCNPALNAYIADAAKGRDLGQTFTMVFAGMSLGMVISPPIGGLMMENGDMRYLFHAAFVLFSISTVAMCLLSDQPREVAKVEMRKSYGGLLLDRRMIVLSVLFLLIYFCTLLGRSFSSVYLEEVSGLPRSLIGSLGTALSIGSVVLAIAVGALSSRFGSVWALFAAEGLLLAGYAIFLPFVGIIPAALAYFLWGSGNPISSLTRATLGQILSAESMGKGYAIQYIIFGLATTAAPYASSWLYVFRPDLPFLLGLLMLPLLMLATLGLRRYGFK